MNAHEAIALLGASGVAWKAFMCKVEPRLLARNKLVRSDLHAAGTTLLAAASIHRLLPEFCLMCFTAPYMLFDGVELVMRARTDWPTVMHHSASLANLGIGCFFQATQRHHLISWCYAGTEFSTLVMNNWKRRRTSRTRFCIHVAAYFMHRVVFAGWIAWSRSGPFVTCSADEAARPGDYVFVWIARLFHFGLVCWWLELLRKRKKYY